MEHETAQERQMLEEIRRQLAEFYKVPMDLVEIRWDGRDLSARIHLQQVGDTELVF